MYCITVYTSCSIIGLNAKLMMVRVWEAEAPQSKDAQTAHGRKLSSAFMFKQSTANSSPPDNRE